MLWEGQLAATGRRDREEGQGGAKSPCREPRLWGRMEMAVAWAVAVVVGGSQAWDAGQCSEGAHVRELPTAPTRDARGGGPRSRCCEGLCPRSWLGWVPFSHRGLERKQVHLGRDAGSSSGREACQGWPRRGEGAESRGSRNEGSGSAV